MLKWSEKQIAYLERLNMPTDNNVFEDGERVLFEPSDEPNAPVHYGVIVGEPVMKRGVPYWTVKMDDDGREYSLRWGAIATI